MPDTLRCDWCSAGFVASNKRGPKPRYCTPACRQRAFADRRTALTRVERYVLSHFKAAYPHEYATTWADAETQGHKREQAGLRYD